MSILCHLNIGVAGYYTLHKGKVDADGVPIEGTRRQVAYFKNLITNNGMDRIYEAPGGAFGIQYIPWKVCVGTGSTAPTVNDGTLATFLALSGVNETTGAAFVDAAGGVPPYWKSVKTWRFNAGTATGNLTEVGSGWAADNLFSRALILDGGGSPTTITVLADEYLDVTFEWRNYIDVSDVVGSVSINGVLYDTVTRPADIDSNWGHGETIVSNVGNDAYRAVDFRETDVLGTVYNVPAGGASRVTWAGLGYTNGTFTFDFDIDVGLDVANFATGIGSAVIIVGGLCRFQMNFTPKIPKDNTKIMDMTFRVSWSRYP